VTHWDHNGIRMPSASRTRARCDAVQLTDAPGVVFPFELAAVERCVRQRDLDGLLALRDMLTRFLAIAAVEEIGFREPDRDELHALKDALGDGVDTLTRAVALSDRPELAERVEQAKASLYGGEDAETQARAKAVKGDMTSQTDADVKRRADEVRRAMRGTR
jgi:hypothetical protein